MKKLYLYLLLVPVFIIGAVSSCTRIDAGHEGVLVKLYGTDKGVQDVSLVTGRVWYNPFTEEVFEFPTFVQTVDYPNFTVNAKDGSVFTVDPTISFRVIAGESPRIFAKYRKDIGQITQTTLFNYTRDAFRIQFNQYSTDSIISNRQSFEDKVQKALGESLQREGFQLEQMTSGLQYPEVIVQAVNLKNQAVQQAMQVENELKVAEAQARKKIVEAEAEARANELRQRTLTPLLIQQQFIEKWDGKTPLYGNSPIFFKNVN
ncbi:prohibitin family protein [Rhabdobacter roseus]|uniref:Regulator of protease activity HflC (Stomatin/prohibitin superfamily) n=1 Tax=Rhabdobacter roseus TaxID=1655419 RepID=A0A840TPW3_9BACT|nr:SPFH domain-containing protein [Rhabdobacter roseus]MBB5283602.1 regulator of protease activity HflC (stomatin/prohibitin superfamily) [Rhabdobacter roseus]